LANSETRIFCSSPLDSWLLIFFQAVFCTIHPLSYHEYISSIVFLNL
jgi:hypothetical protein